jgi:hypothetical protein
MAHNLEQVYLDLRGNDRDTNINSFPKKVLAPQSHSKNHLLPCQKLKSIEYYVRGTCLDADLMFQTCAQRVLVMWCAFYSFDHLRNLPASLPLRSLELRCTSISDYLLLKTLFTPAFSQLTHLCLKGIGDSQPTWENCDFGRLSEAFEKYLPNLEYPACILFDIPYGGNVKRFRSF